MDRGARKGAVYGGANGWAESTDRIDQVSRKLLAVFFLVAVGAARESSPYRDQRQGEAPSACNDWLGRCISTRIRRITSIGQPSYFSARGYRAEN